MQKGYQYSSQPRSVAVKRSKYRDQNNAEGGDNAVPQNIMFDRRVVRGSTYSKNHVQKPLNRQRAQNNNRSREEISEQHYEEHRLRPSTPPPVDGRVHMNMQTETYLEELTDKVPEVNEGTQTDSYMDRPAPPVFIPSKTGTDVTTQIEAGDLFDFELEVQPLLEVLVGKTLEVSMMEVLEEEELQAIRSHQENFEASRNAELVEVQRLEAEAARKEEEKERRVSEAELKLAAKDELEGKVAARAYAKDCLQNLHNNVFSNLMESGHFFDPVAREIETTFLPTVIQDAASTVENMQTARALTDLLISEVLLKK